MSTKTQATHTPGPWSFDPPRNWVAHRWKCSVRVGAKRQGNSIAEVYMGGPGALSAEADAVEANASLIAAAPDMLQALKDIAETLDKMSPCPEEILDALLATAQSAIRTAGEKG